MFCGKCGNQCSSEQGYCMACGAKLDIPLLEQSISTNTNIDCKPTKLHKSKCWIISCISVASILVIVVGVILYFLPKDDGQILNTKWGMSIAEVQALYTEASVSTTGDSIIGRISTLDVLDGNAAPIVFDFDSNMELVSIRVMIMGDDINNPIFEKQLISNLNKKYGQPQQDVVAGLVWETETTLIEFVHYELYGDSHLRSLTYTDINMP